jgi:hypothetical protein
VRLSLYLGMTLHAQEIALAQKQVLALRGVRCMALGAHTLLYRGMDRCQKERRLFVAHETKVRELLCQEVIVVGAVGRVANYAQSHADRSVNSRAIIIFLIVAIEAKVRCLLFQQLLTI